MAVGLALIVSAGAAPAASRKPLPPLPQINLEGSFPSVRRQVRQAEALVRAQPTNPAANGKLGMVLDAYEQYSSAAVCYRRALLLDPRSSEWLYDLGWVEFKQGQYAQAAETFRAVVAIPSMRNYLPAWLKLADSVFSDGQFEEARTLYKKIAQEQPDSAEAHYGLGRVETAEGRTQEAAASLEKACELFPQYGVAQYALALAYRKLGQPEKAENHFAIYQANVSAAPPSEDRLRAAVQELNQAPVAYLQRGLEMAQGGNLSGAIQEYQRAVELDPSLVQAHIDLIQLFARAGKSDQAEEEYRTAVRLDPNRAECYYNYGVLMFGLKKLAEAEQAYRRAVELNPEYAEAHNNLGYLLEHQGRTDDAIAEYEAALKSRPDYRLPHYHIATILARQGKYDESIQHLLKTLAPVDDSTPVYLYALGIAYGRKGDRENALKYLRQARDQAAARRQSQLLASIDRDLRALEQEGQR
jgi:tetratricopeptide (TPR) repeat protein